MTKQKFLIFLAICVIGVLALYKILASLLGFVVPLKVEIVMVMGIAMLFIGAGLIATFGQHKEPESFAQRFLILTTYQIFTILIFILAVRYAAKEHFKEFLFSFMGIFLVLMIIQSVLLVKLGNHLKK